MKELTYKEQFVGAIAFAGDLSMGQPVEHSPRVTVLAVKLAKHLKINPSNIVNIARISLLRWAGCTANAREFSYLLGDDIRGRAEMLAGRNPFVNLSIASLSDHIIPLANAHCEAMATIAERAGIYAKGVSSDEMCLDASINDLFENWDGSGYPMGKSGEDIDLLSQIITVVSDLEIFTNQYGVHRAILLIDSRAGKTHDPFLVSTVVKHASKWLSELEHINLLDEAIRFAELSSTNSVEELDNIVTLFSDYAALKQPEEIKISRMSAKFADDIARKLGLSKEKRLCIVRAAKLHRLGFVALSNSTLSARTKNEDFRLASYWTGRILNKAPDLTKESHLASMAFERIDGSGHYRGLAASSLPIEARILATSVLLSELLSCSNIKETAIKRLQELSSQGKLDDSVVEIACLVVDGVTTSNTSTINLTEREQEVLQRITKGLSNKEAARLLEISPRTVGAHLENIYKKLSVSGRTAATMKALEYGLI
ncbi:HD domain-containing phosphohydrolase [Moritella viscosa]|uniref:HD domain-containing phosphohydrolase n=1 Tax=Moritella viscosa TaxID=80854 RepID=UPI0009142E1B|nr:HD domain-containing phosphohydrolase [Moritella viscosa]SGY85956.1 Transcriptional regulator, LuxR family [Moritella viscosa]SGY86315.1 Transcriptional regulator, LuxR family [Moritella viscosa]